MNEWKYSGIAFGCLQLAGGAVCRYIIDQLLTNQPATENSTQDPLLSKGLPRRLMRSWHQLIPPVNPAPAQQCSRVQGAFHLALNRLCRRPGPPSLARLISDTCTASLPQGLGGAA